MLRGSYLFVAKEYKPNLICTVGTTLFLKWQISFYGAFFQQ